MLAGIAKKQFVAPYYKACSSQLVLYGIFFLAERGPTLVFFLFKEIRKTFFSYFLVSPNSGLANHITIWRKICTLK